MPDVLTQANLEQDNQWRQWRKVVKGWALGTNFYGWNPDLMTSWMLLNIAAPRFPRLENRDHDAASLMGLL